MKASKRGEFLLHNELALSVYATQYPYARRGSLNVKGGGTGVLE